MKNDNQNLKKRYKQLMKMEYYLKEALVEFNKLAKDNRCVLDEDDLKLASSVAEVTESTSNRIDEVKGRLLSVNKSSFNLVLSEEQIRQQNLLVIDEAVNNLEYRVRQHNDSMDDRLKGLSH